MAMIFSKEEWATLQEAEPILMRWYRARYVSGCSQSMAARLIEIYNAHATGGKRRLKPSCAQCVAEVVQYLSHAYVAEVERLKASSNGTKKNKRRKAKEQ